MNSRYTVVLSLFLISLLMLTGCGGGDEPTAEPPAAVEEVAPTDTPEPTESPTEAPTEEVAPTEAPAEEAAPTEEPVEEAAPAEEAAPTEEPAEEAAPTEAPAEETASETVSLKFVTELQTIEQLDPILLVVEEIDGILGASGDETGVKITYDPSVITVDEIQAKMTEIGQAVRAAE